MRTIDLTTKVGDLLDSLYSGDEPEEERKILDASQDPTLDILMQAMLEDEDRLGYMGMDDVYSHFRKKVKGLSYTAKHVEQFSLLPGKATYMGLFLTALISNSDEDEFTVHSGVASDPLVYIGFKNNGKKITVHGDVGSCAADGMRSGELIIYGDAEASLGVGLRDGLVHLHGDSGDAMGLRMKGGTIIIDGNVRGSSANVMFGGVIKVHGYIEELGPAITGGDIYEKDRIRVRDGKRLW